ncbi:MAG: hypothetical protein ABJC13_07180 [Acidobacteriota bacterium]
MDLYQRQQFDFLLATAVERYTERLEQRNEGPVQALELLRRDPEGPGIWLGEFAEALFEEFLLGDPAGAAFVLQALERRPLPANLELGGTVSSALAALARAAFADLLRAKTEEALEQHAAFAGAPPEIELQGAEMQGAGR